MWGAHLEVVGDGYKDPAFVKDFHEGAIQSSGQDVEEHVGSVSPWRKQSPDQWMLVGGWSGPFP